MQYSSKTTSISSIPGANRTIRALRDLGYDFNSAVADIIDNSISRGMAENISIYFHNIDNSRRFELWVLDDGVGMDDATLQEAMRFGSSNDDYHESDLSKYGMGMKTASISQAFKLTVLSKQKGDRVVGYVLDIRHVMETDRWEIHRLGIDDIESIVQYVSRSDSKIIDSILHGDSWTLVCWNDLDNFQANYDRLGYSAAINYYNRHKDQLREYLGLVFSRFIDGENSANKINLFLSDLPVKSVDPFCRNEYHTTEIDIKKAHANFELSDGLAPIHIRGFILPTNPRKTGEYTFSSIEAWENACVIKTWNDSQGYYIYRNNRLINWGGWHRTKGKDEHDKLARLSIDLLDEHDLHFEIDIKKTRIQFPEELKIHLKDNINKKIIPLAKQRYNGSEGKKSTVTNLFRDQAKKVSHLAAALVQEDNISVTRTEDVDTLYIANPSGGFISQDATYRMLEAGQKIISMPFDDDTLFWKMVPNPNNEFQVLVNSNHPFYELVYGDGTTDKKVTAVMDAFLFTMSFMELKCISNNNEMLFDQMKEVASTVLSKIVEKDIL